MVEVHNKKGQLASLVFTYDIEAVKNLIRVNFPPTGTSVKVGLRIGTQVLGFTVSLKR